LEPSGKIKKCAQENLKYSLLKVIAQWFMMV
jgi:hypothetical protein